MTHHAPTEFNYSHLHHPRAVLALRRQLLLLHLLLLLPSCGLQS
jgi:hypothetical protein